MASTAFSFPSTLMAIHSQVNPSITLSVRTFLPSRAVLDEVVGPDEIGVSSRTIFILALAAAGENDPFILVTHSLGDPTAWPKFGDQVTGLVFVDATHPDRVARFSEVGPMIYGTHVTRGGDCGFPVSIGCRRLEAKSSGCADGIPVGTP
ncbi:hypothetical protein ACQZ40_16810 [Agrobacterium sp. 16-172Ci]|uniref:hypothetical protein n=1 Tax=Agrobacterium TaxID=357 RepID=UPI001396A69D